MLTANDSNNHELMFNYDSLNRLTSETQSGAIVNYTYDNNNNITNITNPDNKTTNYTYDTLNRVTTIKQNNETIINNNFA
ncbi:MAG: hypothetical protein Q8M44_07550 [bacterium]|nr:hypothetical protein [bacterium]